MVEEELEGLRRHALLREVEEQGAAFEAQPLEAARVAGKEIGEAQGLRFAAVADESAPARELVWPVGGTRRNVQGAWPGGVGDA